MRKIIIKNSLEIMLELILYSNQFLKDFVETDENDNITKVLGTGMGFVLIGGIKHNLF